MPRVISNSKAVQLGAMYEDGNPVVPYVAPKVEKPIPKVEPKPIEKPAAKQDDSIKIALKEMKAEILKLTKAMEKPVVKVETPAVKPIEPLVEMFKPDPVVTVEKLKPRTFRFQIERDANGRISAVVGTEV